MRLSNLLAALATAGLAVAGPLTRGKQQAGSKQQEAGSGTLIDRNIHANATSTPIIGSGVCNHPLTANHNALTQKHRATRTDTITSTVTLTVGSGPGAYVTTTTKVETVQVVLEYFTVYVKKAPSPGPTKSTTTAKASKTKAPTTTTTTTTTTQQPVTSTVSTPPSESTRAGTVSGCTKWDLAVPGDTCSAIASRNSVDVNAFMSWNPSVNPPTCSGLWANIYYCVCAGGSGASSSAPTTSRVSVSTVTTTTASYSPPATPSGYPPSQSTNPNVGNGKYRNYRGNGTVAAGWPHKSQWLSFSDLWTKNAEVMAGSCSWMNVPSNSPQEMAHMKAAIPSIAAANGLPAEFVLAIVLQESGGCVRVHSTYYPVRNPGLMQCHNGAGTCNDVDRNGNSIGKGVQDPCPKSEITQMITDGTAGTVDGDGLVGVLNQTGYSSDLVEMFYAGARLYNGGISSNGWNKQDLSQTAGTKCYASDVANRLTGWVGDGACSLS